MPFQKGQPRPPGAGRKKGSPNKASLPWKALTALICEDPAHQVALLNVTLERPELIFKAAEHSYGKPKETKEIVGEFRMIGWPDNEDIAEE